MTTISAELVRELREKTGAGMMDCKKALSQNDGDLEKAIEFLRKQGMASASKKAGRLASEGLIEIARADRAIAMVEVNAETDFVAKTPEFQSFVQQVARQVVQHKPADLQTLLSQNLPGHSEDLQTLTQTMVAKIGENISVRRFVCLQASAAEKIGAYLHMGNKIGALVKIRGDEKKLSEDLLKEISMHVAAAAPRFLNRAQIPAEVIAQEKEIYRAQLKESGKPPEMLDKIVEGKIAKFSAEVCLEAQVFIKDPAGKKSVSQHLQEHDAGAQLVEFVRFQVGEGMAKKEENFAAEVAKQLSQS